MSIEIKVPVLPESVSDATVAKIYKKVGEAVSRDENIVDLETDKVMLEVPAIRDGVVASIAVEEGAVVTAGQVLLIITEGPAVTASVPAPESESTPSVDKASESKASSASMSAPASPSVRRLAAEKEVDIASVVGSGKSGRVTQQDVAQQAVGATTTTAVASTAVAPVGDRTEKRVPMSRLRQRVAQRLVQVQQEAALLTTFNEINMKPVMDLRKKYKDIFLKENDVKLGFMSFFTKAVVEALKRFPAVNASIDGTDILYHNYYDIGIAVGGGPRGLVVPVLRNAEQLSMAAIEKQIRVYAEQAHSGKLALEDMLGGTFTITNGGTYGSMLSTPIINPPQTGILGMHNIVERPVVENGEIVIRPMMYVALSYDHRVIDGSESVRFLVTLKELLEEPARMLLQV